ncbi:MAG: phospho-N-acetylmuramoyl-pentapeptide-transferase [Candidatus Spyradocola sp.]|jgi:phospho-N-acetylmuramoyl-pentapeptide-transferase
MQSMVFALLVAFLAVLAMGPFVISKLRRLNFGATERNYGLETHNKKTGTPIMGGILILAALAVAALVFSPAQTRWNLMLPAVLFALGFGCIGFLDDYIKAVRKRPEGLSAKQKIVLQVLLSLCAALFCYFSPYVGSKIYIPFTDWQLDLGIWYIPFAVFVIVATTNSVNLMDGVDGLLSTVTMIVMAALGFVALFAEAAGVDAEATGTMSVLCAATAGACLGFLRFNAYPARVFMGDTGSFGLGGAYVMASLLLRQPLLILIMGLMYVLESLSDILQVLSIRYRHRRLLRMAPLHHHFEMSGVSERKIVLLFALITVVMCGVGLLSTTM